jgi:hypothetical protein
MPGFDWSAQIDPFEAAKALTKALSIFGESGENDVITSGQKPVQTPEMAVAADRTVKLDAGGSSFVQPFSGEYPLTSGFGPRGEGFHAGLDIGLPSGTPLLAANTGVVSHAGSDDPGGYGTWIEITSPDGISTRYGHLSSLGVKPGQAVSAGQPIGISGATGNARGAHLHFEVRKGGQAIDPTPYLSGATKQATVAPPEPAPDPAAAPAAAPTDMVLNTSNTDPFEPQPRPEQQQPKTTDDTNLPGMDGYFAKVLAGVGASATPANLAFMRAWQRAEGGDTTNPFNTTQDAPGATIFNSVGVKRYASSDSGIQATIQTLTNGMYGNILAALKSGTDPMQAARALAGSPWGTGDLVISILGG